MSSITVVNADGVSRSLDDAGRLDIGGAESGIPVPGDSSGNTYAYVENRGGHAWLVPQTPVIPLRLNGAPVTGATPLRGGDRVVVGQVELNVDIEDRTVRLAIGQPKPASRSTPPQHRPARLGLLKLALFCVFLALLLAASFVFFATPVAIEVTPAPDRHSIEGFPPPVPLKGRYLMLPGEYEVVASKAGYAPLHEAIVVEGGDFREFKFELTKLPGRLTLYSQPQPAEVRIDGEYVGPTPLIEQPVEAGRRRVVVSAERYQDAVLALDVEGMDREQVSRVELAPDWAPVTFRSQPSGASVKVDGEAVGRTPVTVDLLSGSHAALMEFDRHQPATLEVEVTAGEALAAPVVVLVPTPGRLALTTDPPGATVTVDGVYQGDTPLQLVLAPNVDHELALTKAGYVAADHTLSLEPAEEKALSLRLSPEYGVLFLSSDPADADLYVDGKPRGAASQRLRLPVRQHTLEFRKHGYETHRVTVVPRAGVSKEISVKLEPAGTPQVAPAAPDTIRTGEQQELKRIPARQFTMGASRREQGRRANENLRRVVLTRPYYLGVKEVTNGEFRRFKPDHNSGTAFGRSLDQDEQPVVNVSWGDAAAYLNWLSERDGLPPAYRREGGKWVAVRPLGQGYRLPTEAEWANAARFNGGEPRKYAWGPVYPPTTRTDNFADQSASDLLPYSLASYNDKFAVTAPVGSFPANEIGLYDMGGNVAEWTNDLYAIYPTDATTVSTDPVGPESGRHYVIRGASWKDSTISELRLSYRDYGDEPREDVGFRIARYAD